jgi:hypothetical protein
MKLVYKRLSCLLLIYTFSVSFSYQVFGQNTVKISAGFGLPELLNGGIHFQLKQTQIGIRIGFLPEKDESIITASGDVYYHFGGFSELSNIRPWYGRLGLNYMREEDEYGIDKYLNLNPRIGRQINFSNKIGIELDIGVFIVIFDDYEIKKSRPGITVDILGVGAVWPSFGLELFYRI